MDASQIGMLASSLGAARDIGKTLIGIRDHNLVAEKLAALNDQLLQAQQALLSHNATLFELQQQNFEAREELRKLKEAASERGRYTLVDLGKGQLAYRMNVTPAQGASDEPVTLDAPHYICQPCYSEGRKVVLQRNWMFDAKGGLDCPVCKNVVFD